MTTLDIATPAPTTTAEISTTPLPMALPGRLVASLGMSATSIGFGIVAALPRWQGMKPSWAQYQRFSDVFVYALALGLGALMVALFSYRKSSWKEVGFNMVVSTIILAAVATLIAGYAGIGALSIVLNA